MIVRIRGKIRHSLYVLYIFSSKSQSQPDNTQSHLYCINHHLCNNRHLNFNRQLRSPVLLCIFSAKKRDAFYFRLKGNCGAQIVTSDGQSVIVKIFQPKEAGNLKFVAMQSRSPKITIKMGGKRPEISPLNVKSDPETLQKDQSDLEGPRDPSHSDRNETDQNVLDVSLSESSTEEEDKDTPLCDDFHKQIVLYDHSLNGSEAVKAVKSSNSDKRSSSSKAPPEVGAFTVQCANCFKWRLIPDLEKYEVIREHITDQPFTCETTRQWNRVVSCDDPTDIEQDGTRIWAIDKPNIAQPPPGWKRLLRLRREGSSKFADVYYESPTGTKLRSLPDVIKYLEGHPEHAQGIGLGRFSFQIPRPLKENYVKKRPIKRERLEPSLVEPIAWAGPAEKLDLQLAEPLSWAGPMDNKNGMPAYLKPLEHDPVSHAAKKTKTENFSCS
ncbi:hypothetical protein QVD17_27488 [Tagetes erecta]|uniref:Uncharacterized protein n=1 Tax=Tagetes erecta TaxID=13708 RepID=A0AAD8KEX4_TARER|nr:hypothetical protein QVD17_27488 [Tagetes erecta]